MYFKSKQMRVNGITMNVLVTGAGPDVLLVHGFPDTQAVWRKQVQPLVEAGYRVIVPDTRGCGESAMPAAVRDYHIDHLVADLIALLDALKVKTVRLVAHDWGAVIGWKLAQQHPDRVDRYIPLSVGHPASYARDGLAQKCKGYYVWLLQLRGLAERLCRAGNWAMFRLMTRYGEEFPHWRGKLSRPGRLTAGMNYYRANFRTVLFHPDARQVKVPVYAMWSSGDRFLTESQMLDSQRHVDGPWRYTRIERANHWLQLDAPEQVTKTLLDYLSMP